MLLISIGLMLIPAAAFVFLVRGRSGLEPHSPRSTSPYRAVKLITGPESCAKATILAGDLLLAAQAPPLPLEGCDRRCRCSYRSRSDRREINRRRNDDGLPEEFIYAGEEKRRRDRRVP